MSEPLDITFDLLARSPAPEATQTLLAALEVPIPQIQSYAVTTLILHRGSAELIRLQAALPSLHDECRRAVARVQNTLVVKLRKVLSESSETAQSAALDFVSWVSAYPLLPEVLSLYVAGRTDTDRILGLLFNLVDCLADQSEFAGHPAAGHGASLTTLEIEQGRAHVVAALQSACPKLDAARVRPLVEMLLLLARPGDAVCRFLLRESPEECQLIAANLLHSSPHPRVFRLLVESLSQPYPSADLTSAFATRTDIEFLSYVLRHWPRELSATQTANLAKLERLSWLADKALWADIPAPQQPRLLDWAMASGVPRNQKLRFVEWMVRNGCAEARRRGVDCLDELHSDIVEQVVLEGLESENEPMQAWATGQLRAREIPNAIPLLIERVDSQLAEVRQVARDELGSVSMAWAIEQADQFSKSLAPRIIALVLKLDVRAMDVLRAELNHPVQRRRVRALRATLKFGMHKLVEAEVQSLLRDKDVTVRLTAIEVLQSLGSEAALAAIEARLGDSSLRVREMAGRAVSTLREQLAGDADMQPGERGSLSEPVLSGSGGAS